MKFLRTVILSVGAAVTSLSAAPAAHAAQLDPASARTADNAQASAVTFKPRGWLDVDAAAYHERAGGHDYEDGILVRRMRLGAEGTALKWFNYRLDTDFAGEAVTVLDAYVQYTGIPHAVVTVGQHKAPFGLEANNTDHYNVFLERGMFGNAFGTAGAERRVGASLAWSPRQTVNLAGGLFGNNANIGLSFGARPLKARGGSSGVNGRATWEPLFHAGRIVHLGAAGYYRTALKVGDTPDAVRAGDRPGVRLDNGNIADSGLVRDVRSLTYGGLEAATVLGPLTLAGEAGRLWLSRSNGAPDTHFSGGYAYAAYFLTGETRPMKGGNYARVRPRHELGNGGLGALELALRYDRIDLSSTPVPAREGNAATSLTLGLNWYLNPYAKVQLNWIRVHGRNTPLDPVGNVSRGDAFATRLHYDF